MKEQSTPVSMEMKLLSNVRKLSLLIKNQQKTCASRMKEHITSEGQALDNWIVEAGFLHRAYIMR
ncbi:hypothetical protein [Oceanobacillus jeddahense]|uniref:hypothetical protein n=1 Tax=Oceanobacillus jeddahense TaxID=1462527 RepID=UPI0011DE3E2E|nr:hypothetical protein [Oceanobacillus jeddahense]